MRKGNRDNKKRKVNIPFFELSVLALLIFVGIVQPHRASIVISKTLKLLLKILPVYVAVCFLSSFLGQFISKESIKKFLGREAGIKGILTAILIGTLIAGPMWVMFPLFATLLEMGASVGVVSALLATFYIKTPWIPYAAMFLGWKFIGVFCVLILAYAVIFALFMEKISSWLFPKSRCSQKQ